MTDNWFTTHRRQVHLDGHMPEFPQGVFANFNTKKLVEQFVRAKVNYVCLTAKCHFGNSFYYTKVGHRHIGLQVDFLAQTAAECRKHGIKTTAYYSLALDSYACDNHPEWCQVDAEGNHLRRLYIFERVCLNSPYKDEMVLPQLEEIAANYPVDGLWLDIPFIAHRDDMCFCKYCKEIYKLETGHELSPELPETEKGRFRQQTATNFLKELRHIINKHNPKLLIACNQAWKPEHSIQFSQMNDFGVCESHPYYCSFVHHSLVARFVRTLDKPVQIMTSRFAGNWGDSTIKPLDQLLAEISLIIGNGAIACLGDSIEIDGTVDKVVWEIFERCFSFIKQREPILNKAKSVCHCAVLIPRKCMNAPAPTDPPLMPPVCGCNKMLLESHIQHDIFTSLDADKLDEYKIAVMPEPCNYSHEALDKIRKFVRNGGTLIAEGESILENGEINLKDVFGIENSGVSPYSTGYFKPHKEVMGECLDTLLQIRKSKTFKIVAQDAMALADLHFPVNEYSPPDRAFRSEYDPPNTKPSGYAFATANSFGKGKAIYIATNIFRLYWNTNHHWLRQFIAAIFQYVDPQPPFHIQAGPLVEANLMQKDNNILLNLMQYQINSVGDPNATSYIDKVYPLKNIECSVKAKNVCKVILEPEEQLLSFKQNGDYVNFKVPELRHLSIVKLEIDKLEIDKG